MEKPVGELACMGVIRSCRGRGIGKALAAKVTDDLKRRGMTTGYLRWTWLEDWYGSLGYQRWETFHMMSKQRMD
jgi:N-acetylglutamate synthase-like GNAT family acetyltransferase